MIRELINRIVFEVAGEDILKRINRAVNDSVDRFEKASLGARNYDRALRLVRGGARIARAGIRTLARAARDSVDGIRRAGRAVGSFAGGVRQLLTRLAVGPLAFGAFIGAAVRLASTAEETRDRMTVALGDIAEETVEWSTRLSNSLNLNRNQVRSFVTDFSLQLQRATSLARATDIGKELTERAFDLESFSDVPVDEIFAAFRSGINGSTEPLDRFNVNIRATAVDAFILANGMAASSKAITENTRRLARARIILNETSKAQGNLLLTSGSFANVFRSFQNVLRNIFEDIGTEFLPAAVNLFQTIRRELLENQDRIVAFFSNIANRVNDFIDDGGLKRIADLFGDIAEFALNAAGAVDRFLNISQREQDIDQEVLAIRQQRDQGFLGTGRILQGTIANIRSSGDDRALAERRVDERNALRRSAPQVPLVLAPQSVASTNNVTVNVNQTNATPRQITEAVNRGLPSVTRRSNGFDMSSQSPANR